MDAAFKMDPDAFKKEYVFPMPPPTQEDLVIHCHKGIQASAAAAKLFVLGYKPKCVILQLFKIKINSSTLW